MDRGIARRDVSTAGSHEAELARQAKAHSAQAWTEIYNGCYPAIFRYVQARVWDEQAAEDLAAEVFVKALKGIHSYEYRGRPLLHWLYRIAHNVIRDYQRQLPRRADDGPSRGLSLLSNRRLSARGQLLLGPLQDGETDTPFIAPREADPVAVEGRLDLDNALGKLTAAQREVVTLRFLVGLTMEEVAGVLGKKPAAVYSLLTRALLTLRQQLQEDQALLPPAP